MSFGIAAEVVEDPNGLAKFQTDPVTNGLVTVKSSVLKGLNFGLQRVPEEEMPWHVVAFHTVSTSQAREAQTPIARACELFVLPTCFAVN